MALISLDNLLVTLGIYNPTDETRTRYNSLRVKVEAAIKTYCKWGLEEVTGQVDYYDGNGTLNIVLQNPWVTEITGVWLDQTGYYGQGQNPFAAGTELTNGRDYSLAYENEDRSKKGLVRRLAAPSAYWFPSDALYWNQPGGLAYFRGPYWPMGLGNLKVEYTYGFPADAIPDDLQLAVCTAVSVIQNSVKYGWPTQSESLADYNYSLAISRDIAFGEVRQLLSAYRDMPL